MTEQLERYKKIASALSFKSNEARINPTIKFQLEIDGVEITVGPFNINEFGYETVHYWQENDTDQYAIFLGEDEWDSWGTHYSDFGVDFRIAEVERYLPVLKEVYDIFPTPQRFRW